LVDRVIAIDPGRAKCGVAVVSRGGVIAKTIVPSADVRDTVRLFSSRFEPQALVLGGGTASEDTARSLTPLPIPIYIVDEWFSTQRARVRYFKENRPRGWRRLVPVGMLTPSEPYDDYAAILLGEEFLRNQEKDEPAANF
jgi:RNase H-fold protein (predicted Holliday junction resolvase)